MWSLTFRSPEFLIWKCQAFLEQKLLAVSNSSVPCVCNKLDSGNMKSFYLPNKHTPFCIGSMNQLKIKVLVVHWQYLYWFSSAYLFSRILDSPLCISGNFKIRQGQYCSSKGRI